MAPSTPQTARPRRARGSLTTAEILDAAEQLAAEDFAGLTVRALAARLGASPMALYRYFATMDELVDALLDRVLGRFEPAPPTDDWVADLRTFARNHRAVLVEHPWAVAVLFTHPSPGVNATVIGEDCLRILHRGGLPGDTAVATFSAVLALNYGWCAFETARRPGTFEALAAGLATLPPLVFPRTVAVAEHLAGYGSDAHYELALGRLLDGIAAAARA